MKTSAFRVLLVIAGVTGLILTANAQNTKNQVSSIIDMHAHTLSMYGTPPPSVCTNDQEIIFPGWDPRQPRSDNEVAPRSPRPRYSGHPVCGAQVRDARSTSWPRMASMRGTLDAR